MKKIYIKNAKDHIHLFRRPVRKDAKTRRDGTQKGRFFLYTEGTVLSVYSPSAAMPVGCFCVSVLL